ncbi:MAG: AAA family ATPase [Candidatus Odinarchaeia archaeon]
MVLILGVTGMPGSGKGEFTKIAKELKLPVISMGDIVRNEAIKRGLPLTGEVLGGIALNMRAEGQDAIAKRVSDEIDKLIAKHPDTKIIVVDGVRSIEEVKYFKEKYNQIILVAVFSSPKTRFNRLINRKRSDDSDKWEAFEKRDYREILLGIGGVIALADYIIINESTMDEFCSKSKEFLQKLLNGYKNEY